MLICNNCGESNPTHVHSCDHCKMPGALTPKINAKPVEEVKREIETLHCLNCGDETAAEETKCQHCSFPLSNKALGTEAQKQLPLVKSIRKTG